MLNEESYFVASVCFIWNLSWLNKIRHTRDYFFCKVWAVLLIPWCVFDRYNIYQMEYPMKYIIRWNVSWMLLLTIKRSCYVMCNILCLSLLWQAVWTQGVWFWWRCRCLADCLKVNHILSTALVSQHDIFAIWEFGKHEFSSKVLKILSLVVVEIWRIF